MTKTILKKKKFKKAKLLSEEALQIAEKRREAKGKGERERYPTECRVSENSKKRYENLKRTVQRSRGKNQIGKRNDLFNKIGDIKGIFHARMGTIKIKNNKTETVRPNRSEEMKRWQEYTEELYKKSLNNLDNHNGVVIHLEHPGV